MERKYKDALKRATTPYGETSLKRWAQLAASGATDDEIIAELNYNFGTGDGTIPDHGVPEFHVGNPPRVWFSTIILDGHPHLSGKNLILQVRRLYRIPHPPDPTVEKCQPRLF